MRGNLLEAVDDPQNRCDREDRAEQVRAACLGIPELRQQHRSQDQQERHHRDAHQENRAPPEVLQQEPTEGRADHGASRVAGDPDRDGDPALLRVEEHVANQGEGGRRQGRPGEAEHRASRDQHLRALRERGEHRRDAERGGADQQQPAAADPVAQRPHGDQRPGDQKAVDVDDPQQLRAAGLEVRAERRHREVQHGQVHRVEQAGQGDHGEPDPLAARRLGAAHAGSISTLMPRHFPWRNRPTLSAHRVMWPNRMAVQMSAGRRPRVAWNTVQRPSGTTI